MLMTCNCSAERQCAFVSDGRLVMRCSACGRIEVGPTPAELERVSDNHHDSKLLWLIVLAYGCLTWFLATLLVAVTLVPAYALMGAGTVLVMCSIGLACLCAWAKAWRRKCSERVKHP